MLLLLADVCGSKSEVEVTRRFLLAKHIIFELISQAGQECVTALVEAWT